MDRASAEDLVQETFVTAWQNLPALRDEKKLRSWLYGIAYRRYLKYRERLSSQAEELTGEERAGPGNGDPASDASLTGHVVREALRSLPDTYAQPLVLLYWEGLSYQEAAGVLSLPIGTLAWRVHKALKLMRGALAEKGVGDESISEITQANCAPDPAGED